MSTSKEILSKQAKDSGFRPEILEKVWLLMDVLNEINIHPFLNGKLVLKGGTALNLFLFNLPRLSVDIDLNYVGQLDREQMQKERPVVEETFKFVCENLGLTLTNSPGYHAGGKFQLIYKSVLGFTGNLEVDLNYLYRVPLWEIHRKTSVRVGNKITNPILILSAEELAAGKLTALFSRKASRDLFDAHHFLRNIEYNPKKLKLGLLAYGIMSSTDIRKISIKNISLDKGDFERKLVPVMDMRAFSNRAELMVWATKITEECKKSLEELVSFSKEETKFLDIFYTKGIVDLELITDDKSFIENFTKHPLLSWRKQQLIKEGSSQISGVKL